MAFEFIGGDLVHNDYVRKAYEAGYLVVEWRGKYCLYDATTGEELHEFDTSEELNRMMKLLVKDE